MTIVGTLETGPVIDPQLWLRRFADDTGQDAEVRLVCFPHAGGSASFYTPMAQSLAPRVDVLAVQYPGRQDRRTESCVGDIGELAGHIAAALLAWEAAESAAGSDGSLLPLAFFGHSMGAVTAYEVALRLMRAQQAAPGRAERESRPFRLFASGRRAPSRIRETPMHLEDDDRLIEEVATLGGTSSLVFADPELRALVLPALRSDYRAIEAYRFSPGDEAPCPVTVLTGDADPNVTLDEAHAWAEHSQANDFEVKVLPGGHFFLVEQAAEVLALLRERLLS